MKQWTDAFVENQDLKNLASFLQLGQDFKTDFRAFVQEKFEPI
jgi:hypothetical protein